MLIMLYDFFLHMTQYIQIVWQHTLNQVYVHRSEDRKWVKMNNIYLQESYNRLDVDTITKTNIQRIT